MKSVQRVAEAIASVLETIIAGFFFVILIMTILLVALRYGLNTSIKGGYELTNYLFIYTTAIGAAVSVNRHQHIKIDVLINKLSGRTRLIADVLVQVLIGGINVVLLVLSLPWITKVGSFLSPVLRVPNWTIEIAVPIGSALVILFCALNIIRDIAGQADLGGTPSAPAAD